MVFGLSIAFMLTANIGLGPWDVFHQGVAQRTPLTIGQAMVAAGLALLIVSAVLAKVRPGVGTVLNMALIGPWVDLFLAVPGFPQADGGVAGWGLFVAGLVLNGFAIGGVAPVGLAHQMPVLIDEDLLDHDVVWAAAGTPKSVFPIDPDVLRRISDAKVVRVVGAA